MNEKVKEEVEKIINSITEEGIQTSNIDYLYKLIDIHKDLANEEYWQKKKEVMQNEIQRIRRIW